MINLAIPFTEYKTHVRQHLGLITHVAKLIHVVVIIIMIILDDILT